MNRTALRLLVAAVIAAAALGGCGAGAERAGNKIHGRTLTIWVSVPLDGAAAASGEAVVRGAALALRDAGSRIGRYRIVMHHLDDSDPTTDRWDPGQTAGDARIATQEPSTIGYIGELDSGASAVSIPLLNSVGIAEISPGSTAVGLTSDAPGANAGEPQKYYPTGMRTFVRLPPSDLAQANVQISLQRQDGCNATYVLEDGEVDGDDDADTFVAQTATRGLSVAGQQSYDPTASSYATLGQAVAHSGANCVLIAAIADANTASLVTQIGAAVPDARLFATDALAISTFVNPKLGGIPAALDGRLLITAPAPAPQARARALAATFEHQYEQRYGQPEPVAVYGYEAMSLLLDAVSRATRHGRLQAERSRVVRALFATRDRHSVLGNYSVQANGDTTLQTYGAYRVIDGQLRLWRVLRG